MTKPIQNQHCARTEGNHLIVMAMPCDAMRCSDLGLCTVCSRRAIAPSTFPRSFAAANLTVRAHAGSPEQVQVDAESGRHLIAPLGPFGSLWVPLTVRTKVHNLSCLISLLVLCRFWNWNHDVVFLSFFQ